MTLQANGSPKKVGKAILRQNKLQAKKKKKKCVCLVCESTQSLSYVWHFSSPQTVAHQVPLSMEFVKQEWVAISYSGGSSQLRD